ncbi:MAG: c-type cytochrome [Motiliproteus sp.]
MNIIFRISILCASLCWSTTNISAFSFEEADLSTAPTTFEKYLPYAQQGDADTQHLMGFMFLHGEGVPIDYDKAHHWLHQAADQGHIQAQRLLGIFHSRSLKRIPTKYYLSEEANYWFSRVAKRQPSDETFEVDSSRLQMTAIQEQLQQADSSLESGEIVFQSFCAGCHGFDGNASYPASPSFAKGERLHKDNDSLSTSILNGLNLMPAWNNTLTTQQVTNVLGYIRTLDSSTTDDFAVNVSNDDHPAKKTFLTFCGGCHGFNGISYYVHSPSFALGERLNKDDNELKRSLSRGKGEMPGWDSIFADKRLDELLDYIRTLEKDYKAGIITELSAPTDMFFRFKTFGPKTFKWFDFSNNDE